MKNLINTILRTGFTRSQKPLEDYIKYLYPLKYILRVGEAGFVCCNHNPFWRFENKQNQMELYHDIRGVHRRSMTDDAYFRIINRFENGDKYGIIFFKTLIWALYNHNQTQTKSYFFVF